MNAPPRLAPRRGRAIAGTAAAGVLLGGVLGLRNRLLRWGATAEEVRGVLPGDDLLPSADLVATRAITVYAPAAAVWPWIAQIGQGRGGFYSYTGLENFAGCDLHNADEIVPEWQDVSVGDEVRLHPEIALQVAAVESGRALVLSGGVPMGATAPPYDFTWAFVLAPVDDATTRFVVRERYAYTHRWAPLLVEPVSIVSFVMTRKMLSEVRERAERVTRLARRTR